MCTGDHPTSSSSLIDKITRQMAAEALRAEADAYVAYFAGERDKHGHRRGGALPAARHGLRQHSRAVSGLSGRSIRRMANRQGTVSIQRERTPSPS